MRRLRLAGELVALGIDVKLNGSLVALDPSSHPLRGTGWSSNLPRRFDRARRSGLLGLCVAELSVRERQIRFDAAHVRIRHECHLSKTALALPALAFGKVPLALLPTRQFAGAGHLETLCDGLASFCLASCSSHGAEKVAGPGRGATPFFKENLSWPTFPLVAQILT